MPPPTGSNVRAWSQVAAAFVALSVLASQLPTPPATLAALFGWRPLAGAGGAGGAGGVAGVANAADAADAAMLLAAAVSVWLLLLWVALISTVAVAGRLPGVVGAAARAGLVALAPVAVRNVLLTVVGASVVTGLAGCTTVGASDSPVSSGSAGAVAVGASSTAVPGSATAPFEVDAAGSPSASQFLAERLVGIATLRISDRIAVEGSAVRSAGPAPAGGGPAAPGLDWPASAASATAPATSAPAAATAPTTAAATKQAPPTPPDGPATAGSANRPAVPTVSVDWPGPAARGARSADGSVVVLRGDSLWTIAARSLPAGADDAAIDRTWHAWYAANTSVIGSNPDYLLPGQILQPPTTGTGTP